MTDIRNIAHLVSDIKADLSAATSANRENEQTGIPEWRAQADAGIKSRAGKREAFNQQFNAAIGKASPTINAERVASNLGLSVPKEASRTAAAPMTPAMQRTGERQR